MVDPLACSNIALVVLVLPFCKINVSYHTYLIFSPQMMPYLCMLTLWSWMSAMRCRDRMKCCFKSGGNNYYKYLAVLSFYGCAGHILTSIVTRWAQLLSMQASERAREWDEDTVLSIGCGFQVLHSLSDFSISSVCVLTCKHPQRYKYGAHFGERAFSLKAVVCYENRRWQQRWYGVHPDKSHVFVCQSL